MIRAFWKEIVHDIVVLVLRLLREKYIFSNFGRFCEVEKIWEDENWKHDGARIERNNTLEPMKIIDSTLRAGER